MSAPSRFKFVALAIAIGCIALQAGRRLDLALLSAALWVVTVTIVDRAAMRRMFMPKFWGVTILFALASGLLLGERDTEILFGLRLSARGLEAGALMVCRGLFIFALVSWASRAIDGAVVRRLATGVGLGNLSVAVGSAFGVLPALRDRLVERRAEMKGARQTSRRVEARRALVDVVCETVRLSERLLAEQVGTRAGLIVVRGSPSAGKTTAVTRIAESLEEQGLVVGGIR